MVSVTLGDRLREAREMVEGLSTRELSRLAGLKSEGHVHGIESGERPNPLSETLMQLASTLGVDPRWLFDGSGKRPSAASVRAAIAKARSERSAA
jgi:transcriptional regulator with XRE-family HTH domain